MRKLSLSLVVLVLVSAFFAVAVMADNENNNPRINEDANACAVGGTLEGKCDTELEWVAGWYLIRYEAGMLTIRDIPGWINWVLPEAFDSGSGFIPGFDFNDPNNPNTGNFGGGNGGGTGGGNGGGTGGDTGGDTGSDTGGDTGGGTGGNQTTSCDVTIPANLATAWGTTASRTVSADFINGLAMSSADLSWHYQQGDMYMNTTGFWYIRLTMPAGWTTMYTFDTSYTGQPRWTGDVENTNCAAPTAPVNP